MQNFLRRLARATRNPAILEFLSKGVKPVRDEVAGNMCTPEHVLLHMQFHDSSNLIAGKAERTRIKIIQQEKKQS